MAEKVYAGPPSKTKNVFEKFEERIGVKELNHELTDQLKGYSGNVMRLLGGISLASVSVLFITGFYIILNHALMLSGPMLFQWNIPFIDYAESLYCWAANSMIFFSSLILIRGCFYAIYKSHGKGMWFSVLWMAFTPMLFVLLVGIYTGNAACIRIIGSILGLFGLPQLLADANVPIIGICSIIAVTLSFVLALTIYLRAIKRYGGLPVPKYGFQIKSKQPVSDFSIGASKIIGAGMVAYAALGIISMASLAMHGIIGAYNTNTFTALWMMYPLMTLGQHFGDIGILAGVLTVLAYLLSLPFIDRNLFITWKRRKPFIAFGIILMVVYASLGFMTVTPEIGTSAVGGGWAFAPAFTYPELQVIIAPIVICGLLGLYLLKKSAER